MSLEEPLTRMQDTPERQADLLGHYYELKPPNRTKMKTMSWTGLKSWISLNVLKRPVHEMPRDRCEHSAGCYLCPRTSCEGMLNDRHDPDLTKPRPSSSGHCIYVNGEKGLVRLRVSMETANAHRARQAAEEQERASRHLWKGPGYDEGDVAAVLKSFD